MEWYWAIAIYIIGLLLSITLLIITHKLLKDEDMKKQMEKSIKDTIKDKKDEKLHRNFKK